MNAMPIAVPVDHDPIIHLVQTHCVSPPASLDSSPGTTLPTRPAWRGSVQCTLLELVQAIGEVTDDDREVVATVIHLLESGQVRLCGNFRDQPIALFRNG